MTDLRELARELRESFSWEQHERAASVLERLAAKQEAAQASLLRVRSHADWLVGFLSVEWRWLTEPSREFASREFVYEKAQELLAEITAAQAASSEPDGLPGPRQDGTGASPGLSPGSLGAETQPAVKVRVGSEVWNLHPGNYDFDGQNFKMPVTLRAAAQSGSLGAEAENWCYYTWPANAGSSKGRTAAFEAVNLGSSPSPAVSLGAEADAARCVKCGGSEISMSYHAQGCSRESCSCAECSHNSYTRPTTSTCITSAWTAATTGRATCWWPGRRRGSGHRAD